MTGINASAILDGYPGYSAETLALLPQHWQHMADEGAACPRFEIPMTPYEVMADYADEAQREVPGWQQYALIRADDRGSETLFSENDFGEILAAAIGNVFADLLMDRLGAEQFAEMQARNDEEDGDSCASHDYCDANMVMSEAFVKVTGRECRLPCDVGPNGPTQAEVDADMALWNSAWDYAKANRLSE